MATKTSAKSTDSRFSARRDRLAQKLGGLKVDAMLVSDPINVGYLTGFTGEDSLLVLAKGLSVLVSDSRFSEQIEEECPGLEMHIRRPGESMDAAVGKILKRSSHAKVGFESTHVTVARLHSLKGKLPDVSWTPLPGVVQQMRMIKDRDEIKQIKAAITMAEKAFVKLRDSIQPSDDEKTLADRLDNFLRQAGAKGSSFPPIIAVGSRAALPHAVPTDQKVSESDFVLIDWGAKGTFYCSDLTRVLVTGKNFRKLAKIYNIVLEAQLKAIDAIRPGASCGDVDAVARDHIRKAGYGPKFGHSLGHGIGIEVHEDPGLRGKSEVVLKTGMVVTVEPGIYIPGWGGVRIEDDILVTANGTEVLSSLTKNLDEMTLS